VQISFRVTRDRRTRTAKGDHSEGLGVTGHQQTAMKRPTLPDPQPEAGPHPEGYALVYQAVLNIWDREADRFWVRNNLLLLVNGVLLGVATAATGPPMLRIASALFGVFLSIQWLMMNAKGGYYVSRWRPIIERMERTFPNSLSPVRPLNDVRPDGEVFSSRARFLKLLRGTATPRRDTGSIMHAIILAFVAIWIGVLIAEVAAQERWVAWLSSLFDGVTSSSPGPR
jgi:hypothetical protein